MAESSSNKRMNLTNMIPDDLIELIMSTFLPIRYLLKYYVLSKRFWHTEIRCRDLDFTGISSRRHPQLETVDIINNVFEGHKGPEIHRFAIAINHTGVHDRIVSWINMCIGKGIKELLLDFSKSKRVIMEVPIDFSAINTLETLKLRWCKFGIPEDNSPKGLKLLKNLSLMRTGDVTTEMIDAIFRNCIYLESLELIECLMIGMLNIHARNHKKFKSLVVSSMRNLRDINVDAPTLEYYKYDGRVIEFDFVTTNALREAHVYYYRTKNRRCSSYSSLVMANMRFFTKVSVLATTPVFLEALTYKYVGRGRMERSSFEFVNLTEFKIFFKDSTFCTLFDIAQFLKDCPNLQKVLIDIQNFAFEDQLYFWEMHHKEQIEENAYLLEFLKEVKIIGYKGHWHELDIVEFFVKNAPSLEKLELAMPKKAKYNAQKPDFARINRIKGKFPTDVTEV